MSKDKEATSDKHPPFHIELAQKVIENLKTNGSLYTPGWKDAAPELPFNPASNRRYRGGKLLNLWLTAMLKGWNDPRWMSFSRINPYRGATDQI
jgi:antirestriction protein ArdC